MRSDAKRASEGTLARLALLVSASFPRAPITLDGVTLRVRCEIVNRYLRSVASEDGWAASYHLFDEPTGTLVVDGARTPLDIAPARAQPIALEIALPPEPGEYNIYFSVMREHVAGFTTEGWPFLLIDYPRGENGTPRLEGWRIADRRSLAMRRMVRCFGRAFTLPFVSIWTHRRLIRTLVGATFSAVTADPSAAHSGPC